MPDQIVSQPDHGEQIIQEFGNGLFATPRLQLYFDDITRIINSLETEGGGDISFDDFLPSSVIYRPTTGLTIQSAIINPNEFLGRGPTGEIQGLDFVEAWDILGNGTTNITLNQTGGANDFTVESASSSRMFVVQGGNNRVSIAKDGLIGTDGLLHVLESQAGGSGALPITASPDADDLVLEHDFFGGASILNGPGGVGTIAFGSTRWSNTAGELYFLHDVSFGGVGAPTMGIDVRGLSHLAAVSDEVDGSTTGLYINPNQETDVDFQVNTVASAPFVFVDSSSNQMGISDNGIAPSQGLLHIIQGGASGATVSITANALVIDGDGSLGALAVGMSILSRNDDQCRIYFGDVANPERFLFQMNHFSERVEFWFDGTSELALTIAPGPSRELVISENAVPGEIYNLRCESNIPASNAIFMVDAQNGRAGCSRGGDTLINDGLFHLVDSDAGVTTTDSTRNLLVLEGNGAIGMTFIGAPASFCGLAWTAPTHSAIDAEVIYSPDSGQFVFNVKTLQYLKFDGDEAVFNDSGNDLNWRYNSQTINNFVFMDAALNVMGISRGDLVPVHGALHIQDADAGTISPSTNGDLIVLEDTGEMGISFLTDNAGFANIYYGNPANGNTIGHWRWDAANSTLEYFQNARSNLLLAPLENVFNEGGLSNIDLRAESDNNPKKLWLDASADELYTRAGGATVDAANARISGTLSTDNSTQGTTAVTTEETLLSFSLPAFSLGVNGQGVRIKAWGTTAANANNKQVRLKFGATNVLDTGAVASNNETWHFVAEVFRTGAGAQDAVSAVSFFNGVAIQAQITNPAETLSGAVTIAVSGQNGTASANDIVAEGLIIEYI